MQAEVTVPQGSTLSSFFVIVHIYIISLTASIYFILFISQMTLIYFIQITNVLATQQHSITNMLAT